MQEIMSGFDEFMNGSDKVNENENYIDKVIDNEFIVDITHENINEAYMKKHI